MRRLIEWFQNLRFGRLDEISEDVASERLRPWGFDLVYTHTSYDNRPNIAVLSEFIRRVK